MSTPEIYRYDGENPPVKVGGVSALLPALVPISYQDFMDLSQEERESGSYIVTNMPTLMNAYSLGYKDGLSAGQKLDQLSSDLTELATYSSTETVIGTYDGKPLYRKTYYIASPVSLTYIDSTLKANYVDKCLRTNGSIKINGAIRIFPWLYANTEAVYTQIDGGGLAYVAYLQSTVVATELNLVVEYTKASD